MDYNKILKLVKKTKNIIFDRRAFDVSLKGKLDFVTNIDIAVSNFLKTELQNIDASIGFFCEEEKGVLKENCWILDPIDGTVNLVYDYRMSAVSLAHYKNGEIVFGVIYNPFTDEMFWAQKDKGAFYNGIKKISVSDKDLKDSLIEFGMNCSDKRGADTNFKIAKEIFEKCVDIRRVSSAALDLCYISIGRIGGYFEKELKPWDIAAGSLILTEAGGIITDYSGKPVSFFENTSVVAGNQKVHKELIEIVNKH